MIDRDISPVFKELLKKYPVVTITGPRQSGKSTLAKTICSDMAYVTLEDIDTRQFAATDPRGFLSSYPNGAVIDEFQRAPDLASYLQGFVDTNPRAGQFVLTGSQQFELMHRVTQSLAGRTAILRLLPFSLAELMRLNPSTKKQKIEQILFAGFYPRIHDRKLNPSQALADYFSSYVQRDLRDLASVHDLNRFIRFVGLCAGRVGQLINVTNLANDAGIAQSTASAWLDLLQTSNIVFLLAPWFVNTSKRLIKNPKLYFYDVGLAAWLLGIREPAQIVRDPLWGALFENFVVVEAIKDRFNRGESAPIYFYRDSSGHEVDLVIPEANSVHCYEIKAGSTVNSDYFRGLKQFEKDHPQRMRSGHLIYGGESNQLRSDWSVWGWRALANRP